MATRTATIVLTARDLASGKIRGLGSTIKAVGAIGGAVGAYQLGRLLVGGLVDSVKAAAESEAAQVGLARALLTSGQQARELLPVLREKAAAMQAATAFDDDAILTNQALLVSIGQLRAEGLERATRAALDLAAAKDGKLEPAFEAIAKAAAGNLGQLKKLGIQLDEDAVKTRGFDAVLEQLEGRFGGRAAARLGTFTGQVEALTVTFGDLQEAIGGPLMEVGREFLSEFLTPLIRDTAHATEQTNDLRAVVLDSALAFAELLRPLEVVGSNVQLIGAVFRSQFGSIDDRARAMADGMKILATQGIDLTAEKTEALVEKLRALRDADPTDAIVNAAAAAGDFALPDVVAPSVQIPATIDAGLLKVKRNWDLMTESSVAYIEAFARRVQFEVDAEGRLLEIRIQNAEEWSAEKERLIGEAIDLEYARQMTAAEVLQADTAAIEAAWLEERAALHEEFEEGRTAVSEREARERQAANEQLHNAAIALGDALFGRSKAWAYARTIIETARAVVEALPNIPLAALVAALGAVQLAKIKSTEPRGFALGGIVQGALGRDVVPARLTRGELVADTTMDEARAILGGRAAIVPAGAAAGGITYVIHGDVIDPEEWFRRNAKSITRGNRRGTRLRARD